MIAHKTYFPKSDTNEAFTPDMPGVSVAQLRPHQAYQALGLAPSAYSPEGAVLPCLSSNNSITGTGEDLPEAFLEKALPDFNKFSKAHKRSACALAWNVANLAEKFGLERLGFLTLTFSDNVTCHKEAQKRFNSLASNVLRGRYSEFIRVWERTKKGRIHYHLVVVLTDDIRSGFDFSGISKQDYSSANGAIRSEWAFWRKTAKCYGFGRTELLPIRSTAEGIARYVGKYISKHVSQREERDKGARLVEYTRGARMASSRFSFDTEGARAWRSKMALFARVVGFLAGTGSEPVPFEKLTDEAGKAWAYHYRDFISMLPEVSEGADSGSICVNGVPSTLTFRELLPSLAGILHSFTPKYGPLFMPSFFYSLNT